MSVTMTSMKFPANAHRDESSPILLDEEYPYGLRLSLSEDSLSKLEMSLPKVGSDLVLVARVKVISCTARESITAPATDRECALQITHMSVLPAGASDDAHELLYKE